MSARLLTNATTAQNSVALRHFGGPLQLITSAATSGIFGGTVSLQVSPDSSGGAFSNMAEATTAGMYTATPPYGSWVRVNFSGSSTGIVNAWVGGLST